MMGLITKWTSLDFQSWRNILHDLEAAESKTRQELRKTGSHTIDKGQLSTPLRNHFEKTEFKDEYDYSPSVCTGAKTMQVIGEPLESQISTSYVERQNLTMRMSMRRFTRLTNAFSKKLENHEHAIALHFMYYNFCRKHQTLRTTPAVAARVTDHVWTVEEMIQKVLESN